jgi:hypothetical protein
MKSLTTTQQTVTFDGFTIKGKLDDNNLRYHPILLEAVRLLNDLKTFALMAILEVDYVFTGRNGSCLNKKLKFQSQVNDRRGIYSSEK